MSKEQREIESMLNLNTTRLSDAEYELLKLQRQIEQAQEQVDSNRKAKVFVVNHADYANFYKKLNKSHFLQQYKDIKSLIAYLQRNNFSQEVIDIAMTNVFNVFKDDKHISVSNVMRYFRTLLQTNDLTDDNITAVRNLFISYYAIKHNCKKLTDTVQADSKKRNLYDYAQFRVNCTKRDCFKLDK